MSKFHQQQKFTPAPTGAVQKCGCGKSADATGECEECKAKKNAEAHQSVQSAGNPLESSTRDFMESKFGQDFSNVRVHTDPEAAKASQNIGANAFTVGNDIAFAPGKFDPSTQNGKKLLAHELTHTLQQGNQIRMQPAEDQEPQQQDALEDEAKGMELQVLEDEEKPEDFDYQGDPELEGDVEPTEEEIAAMLEEAAEQDAIAEEIKELKGEESEENIVAEEESNVGVDEATSLAGDPSKPKRKGRKAKRKPKDEKKAGGAKRIVVTLGTQTATAFEGDKPVKSMKISSGKSTNPTDQGATTITQRDEHHRSNKYGKCVVKGGASYESGTGAAGCKKKGGKYVGAAMTYFQRFGSSAEGFHVGNISRPYASHGCVRLSTASAKWLWGWAKSGTPVNIISGKKAGTKKKKK